MEKRDKYEQSALVRRLDLSRQCGEFLAGKSDIVLEFGCGHGHFLTAYAQAHPDRFCVGIDLLSRRVRLAGEKKDKRGLDNLLFIKAEGEEFLDALPETVSLELVLLLFPDPWPKKRHHRRRLLQGQFLDKLARRTKKGGKLFFRTDHVEYFKWTTELVEGQPEWKLGREATLPFEEGSYFQNLMDSFYSLAAVREDSSK